MSNFIYLRHDYYDLKQIKDMAPFEREIFTFLLLRTGNQGSQIGMGRVTVSDIAHRLVQRESKWPSYNEQFIKDFGVLFADSDFRMGSATSVHNLVLNLQKNGHVTYDPKTELYLINHIRDYCQIGSGNKINYARHIIKQLHANKSPIIWYNFAINNKEHLEDINEKIKNDPKNPSTDYITLDKIIALENIDICQKQFMSQKETPSLEQLNLLDS